ncbi:MAG: peptidoglycan-associated lipoprotein Pal [Paracoccaceae bacterium]|nr:peptidoglycan-associated lipoprotein Pal [Paracoccaceae bacterium]MDE3238685.1 peptidoglycan-associated lipoprotein Pal [Paracoccaceae bacterium]
MLGMKRAMMFAAVLAVAACSQANMNTAGSMTGAASDPHSVAYFNQVVGDRVFFAFDQSNLSPAAQQTLIKQAQWLKANGSHPILIAGNTDDRGTREYNIALGARRAQAVKDFLVAQGIGASRIKTVSYGKERPVATCENESCWSQNRRAVTLLTGTPTS